MAIEIQKKLKKARQRRYLARDFDSFRSELLRYARTYFPDKIQDFSEASFGGLLLDMAAMVGDTMSFYLDHQFNELDWSTAVEAGNIQRHIRNAGVKISGASPAVVDASFFIEVPSEIFSGGYRPQLAALPKILSDTIATSASGINFVLAENIDFNDVDNAGTLLATVTMASSNADGSPATYILEREALCVSGEASSESFSIPNAHVPFRELTLSNESITEILSVIDSTGENYYEVNSLTQDIVFKVIANINDDGDLVEDNLELRPAPYRFEKFYDQRTKLTTLRFGAGNAETLDNDIVPDPSELALPLYGKKVFSRFSIDPNALLQTQTLGISPIDTTITVKYRSGGGLSHNVSAGTIRTVETLFLEFPNRVAADTAGNVRGSVDVSNRFPASGGSNAPTLDELRAQIPSARNMQSRIVTKQDLLARIYTMPSNFGRVYRAGIRANPNNPLATQLFVVCRDKDRRLTTAPDALKKNMRTYLNQFRLISDAIDVLDARIVNFGIEFSVIVSPSANKNEVIQTAIAELKEVFKVENFQIDQPLIYADVVNVIINIQGVIALPDVMVTNIRGSTDGRTYSNSSLNIDASTINGMIVGPPGSLFELRYPEFDIMGSAS
ncbi:MAG TPA: hypothetical protein EYG51_18610 [Pseudomonadales bacterium]|nr:hypothetical protein [Pseudomonadales bacterium]